MIGDKMIKGITPAVPVPLKATLAVLPVMSAFVILGMVSGMWIQLGIMAVTLGIFVATITMKKSDKPRGRVIRLADFGIDSVEDLDEVA